MSVAGIDFGNQACEIAICRRRGVDVCPNEVSKRETSTLVGFQRKLRFIGEAAASQQQGNLKNTCSNFKRVLGRQFSDPDVQRECANMTVPTVAAKDGTVAYKVWYGGEEQTLTATQVTSIMLHRLRELAEKEASARVVDTVLSCPVWYSDQQRRALVDAAQIAGLNVLGLLNESTAAAISWGMPKLDLPEKDPVNVVFLDLGESSLTVTAAAFTSSKMQILGTSFDKDLGGRNIDQMLTQHFIEQAKKKKLDVSENRRAQFRISVAAEKLKQVLSANSESVTTLECLQDDMDFSMRLSRDELSVLLQPLVDRIIPVCQDLLARTGLSLDAISAVELIGASTRIPAVKEAARKIFQKDPSFTLHTTETISRGCALLGAVLSPAFQTKPFEVHDILAYPIEMQWRLASGDGVTDMEIENTMSNNGTGMYELFKRDNQIPSVKQVTLAPSESVEITAFYKDPAALPGGVSNMIGKFTLADIPAPTSTDAKIQCKARLNWYGCVAVDNAFLVEQTPEEPVEGKEAKVKVTRTEIAVLSSTASLSRSELQNLIEAERKMQAQDKEVHATADAKNAVEAYIYDLRSKLRERLNEYALEADKTKFSQMLDESENWLYDVDEDAPRETFVKKLVELRTIGDPIEKRFQDEQEREHALEALGLQINLQRAYTSGKDYAHIEKDEIDKVFQETAAAEQWMNDTKARLAALKKHQDPPVWVSDINSRRQNLESYCKKIFSKPKPKPVDPKPAPQAQPTTPAPEPTENTEMPQAPEVNEPADEKPAV